MDQSLNVAQIAVQLGIDVAEDVRYALTHLPHQRAAVLVENLAADDQRLTDDPAQPVTKIQFQIKLNKKNKLLIDSV